MKLYKLIFEGVKSIVYKHDPVGLVEGGAPDDEYQTEIGKIVVLLRVESDRESLAHQVQEVFAEAYDDAKNDKQLYLLIAQQLLDLKQRLRW